MTTAAQRGSTAVSDKAVRRIAERAATEALPAHRLPAARGSATVPGRRAEVALAVTLPYPVPLARTVRHVQEHVAGRTRQLTGLDVPTPRVTVIALSPVRATPAAVSLVKGPATAADRSAVDPSAVGRTPRRWWSPRRLPTAVLTLSAALSCGALAVDLILVHTGHQPPSDWRTSALDRLSRHGPADAGAGGALLGLWLLTMAVAPGHRNLLTMTAPAARRHLAVDRSAVAALMRNAVSGTQGTGGVKVRVGRRSVTVRAGLAFGDSARAQADVTSAARRVLTSCALRRTPRPRVRVRPEAVWTPPETGKLTAAPADTGRPPTAGARTAAGTGTDVRSAAPTEGDVRTAATTGGYV
ncbi:DUF6286 domain-containing Asp23/Gls24 family envelope stress response protein [Streptomyces sp. Tue6028]|uniref:DUF6286 domain-containing Asp23/Gls24 family envelope stress response protein n=1 Tax=Streptomyces sp. Tue6028 TaxID=2036037 RepID=UPI003EC14407